MSQKVKGYYGKLWIKQGGFKAGTFNPNQAGGPGDKCPTANQNNYISGINCPIDLKPSCKYKFVHRPEVP